MRRRHEKKRNSYRDCSEEKRLVEAESKGKPRIRTGTSRDCKVDVETLNVEFQPAEIIAQTSENLKSDDDDDDDGAEDVFYEPLQHLKEDLQKSIHDRSGAYEEFLDQYPKVAQEYVDRYYKQSDEIDHSYGLKHDMKTDDWSMGSQKDNFLPNGDIKVGGVSYKGTQGLYDLLFLKKPIYQTEDDKLQFTDILNRTNVHRRDFDPSKQVKGSTSSKYKQFVKPLVSTSSEAKRLKSMKSHEINIAITLNFGSTKIKRGQ
ncbi:unnamed protein product [Ceutorhynchus assimilis]|uniref:DUF8207 domain-containing protein n=1 Tax=Ceutorhynchus assimilis TaxID=467358 RepID=A0A9N9QCG9_9CUCU|nr:unnamed protein product [Ceutorhynchus assimilis]